MIVGLTGGIGTGKTTVAKVFEMLGAKLFYSDDNAKQQYFVPEIKKQIIDLLGAGSYLSENTIDRKYISQQIFSDTRLLQKLNSIIHPAVVNDFNVFVSKHPNCIIIKESALLFETGLWKGLDKIILVVSPLELRIERVMKRDGISKEEVQSKIKSQLSDTEKLNRADFIIQNSEREFVIEQCLSIYKQLKHV